MKFVKLPIEIHKKLKAYAVKKEMTMTQVVVNALKNYGVICLCILMVSCSSGSKTYTYVDKVDMKRFNHDQKMEPGMTQEQVMAKFGSPDDAEERFLYTRAVVMWTYYKKIFCGHKSDRCYVMFNNRGQVINHSNIRMEYVNTLVFSD